MLQQRGTASPHPWPPRNCEHLLCSTRVRAAPGLLPCGWSHCLSCLHASAQPFSHSLHRLQQHFQRMPPLTANLKEQFPPRVPSFHSKGYFPAGCLREGPGAGWVYASLWLLLALLTSKLAWDPLGAPQRLPGTRHCHSSPMPPRGPWL